MPNNSSSTRAERARQLVDDLSRAVTRLDEALAEPESAFIRDAAIQRFEFCFELAWKAVQAVARLEGQDCASPRAAFGVAWRNQWVAEETPWLDMLDARNKTSHTYRESVALDVYRSLGGHVPHLTALRSALSARLTEIERQQGRGAIDRPS
jgi:nucleotidyltransferase substrate binding protein (TIGR01987 family)